MPDAGPEWLFEREKVAELVGQLLPVEEIVPDKYSHWRPLVRDALGVVFSHLSDARLAEKMARQWELPAETPLGVRLVALIEKMPGLQKLGQIVARNRYLDAGLREQLLTLENGITDADPDEIGSLVREQLGQEVSRYGVELDTAICSEATVSAVMGFSWLDSETGRRERGVFKVLKPHVPQYFSEDMALLQQAAEFLRVHGERYGFDVSPAPDTIGQTCELLEREIDFRREQANLREAGCAYSAMPWVEIPRVIEPLCTSAITAMTEAAGGKITDAYAGKPRLRKQVAERLFEALIAMPLLSEQESAIFHADPHAGNLFYNEQSSKVILLDWALMERLSKEQRKNIVTLTLMLALRDAGGVAACVKNLSCGDGAHMIDERVGRFVQALPYTRVPGSGEAMELLDELAIAGVAFPAALLMFRKARFTLDGVFDDLAGPDMHLDASLLDYFIRRCNERPTTGAAYSPLEVADWIPIQISAMFYPTRLWASMAMDMFQWC